VPGRALVGVEIPNKVRAQVRLRGLIETPEFQKSVSDLLIPLGKDVAGVPVYIDLARMPHMLVAGSTGTGKTIFLNSLIMSLLYQSSAPNKSASPTHLRLIMVDPKRVEFPVYSQLPHLLCPVIYNATQTVNALRWLTGEMERRFDVLAEARVRNISGYNEKIVKAGEDPMPYIVLIIDELADLMMTRGKDIEAGIVRLAQMARAVGIHLVVATQRPSVEVITGLIKANITCRVTFQVASQIDSRTVLDSSGAEKLLGAGDMLYVSAQVPKPKRIQGAYISEKEVKRVVAHIDGQKEKLETEMNDNLVEELEKAGEEGGRETFYGNSDNGNEDPLYEEAKKVVIEANKASASLLQRRLRLGYARAARLIDTLEARGVVGHGEGAKPREIFGEAKSSEITELSRLDSPSFANNKEEKKDEEDENWEKI
jgi:S-DNA-T family DNA segregation ATPase FtsK/SpoIIIE